MSPHPLSTDTRPSPRPTAHPSRPRHRWRRALWARLQPLPIGLALGLLPRLSRPAIWRLGARLGALAFTLDRRGRKIAEANLLLVYGTRLSARRRRALTRIVYRHAARVLLDVCWFSRYREQRLREWCRIDPAGLEAVSGKACILATAHLGNWEIAGQTLAAQGIDMTSVAKPIGSRRTTNALKRAREATGQEIVFARGAIRSLLGALRKGRLVAIIQDQHTEVADGGLFVDFMGLPAAVSSAAARLSIRMQTPIVTGGCLHDARGRYRCVTFATLQALPDETVRALTQRITDSLVGAIRRHPGQWLWMYKRWKRIPPAAPSERYPFYARPENHNDAPGLPSANLRRQALLGLLLLTIIFALHHAWLADWLQDIQRLHQAVDAWGPVAPLGAIGIMTLWVAAGLPRLPASGLAGVLFGAPLGFCVAHTAVLSGNALMYHFLRHFGGLGRRRRRSHRQARRLLRLRQHNGLLDVIMIRLVPVAAIVQNVPLVAARPSPSAFWLGTLLGTLPGNLVNVALGASLAEDSWRETLLLAAVALLLLGLSSWGIQRLTKRRAEGAS